MGTTSPNLAYKLTHTVLGALLIVALVVLMIGNMVIIWVATGPRSIGKAIPYFEREISAVSGYKVDIGTGALVWDGWRNPLDIRLENVALYTADGVLFARFPDVSLGLDIPSLVLGRAVPSSVVVRNSILSFYQHEDGSVSLGVRGKDEAQDGALTSLPTRSELREGLEANPLLQRLASVRIENADLSIGNSGLGVFLRAENVTLSAERDWGGIYGSLSVDILGATQKSHAEAQVNIPLRGDTFTGKIWLSNFMLPDFSPLLPVAELGEVQLPLTGWVNITAAKDGALKEARFLARAGKGELALSGFAEPIVVTRASVEGVLSGTQTLHITKLSADLDGREVFAQADITRNAQGIGLTLDGGMKNVKAEDVYRFWPLMRSPLSRAWVTENITSGYVPQATLKAHIKPGELDLPQLPDEAIDATIHFTGAQVAYKPEHPPLTEAEGYAHFTANTMQVHIDKAHYMNATRIHQTEVSIPDLFVDNPEIRVAFQADIPAADAVRFLALPDMGHAARLNLNPENVSGSIAGKGNLTFNFYAPRDEAGNIIEDEMIDFDTQFTLADVSLPAFMKRFDASGIQGELGIANAQMRFTGALQINGMPADATLRHLFTPDEHGMETYIAAKATLSAEQLSALAGQEIPYLKGQVAAVIDMKRGKAGDNIQADMDMTQTELDVPPLSWGKPAGTPAQARIEIERSAQATRIPTFTFTTEGAEVAMSAELGPEQQLQSVSAKTFRIGKNDASFTYAAIPQGHRLSAEGKAADVSYWLKDSGESDFSFERIPALDIKVSLDNLVTGENKTLSHVQANIQCDVRYCASADVKGSAGVAPFAFRILSEAKARRLEGKAEDAGAFLAALDITDGIEGGMLTLQGQYDDRHASPSLKGELRMRDYRMRDVPLLAKLLTLASLTGFVDTLQGNGISFTTLSAPFTLENDVITLTNAKTHGPAVGLTAEGTIHFPGTKLDIKGTVVPSYTLNSFFGKVPLIGELLAGPEDGGGIIAARYTMTGQAEDANVSVNPLSILTPGFLRGLFDMMPEK